MATADDEPEVDDFVRNCHKCGCPLGLYKSEEDYFECPRCGHELGEPVYDDSSDLDNEWEGVED